MPVICIKIQRELADHLLVIMRVYFEKPRTTTGWKGLINDPHLDDTYDMATGLRLARKLLFDLAARKDYQRQRRCSIRLRRSISLNW